MSTGYEHMTGRGFWTEVAHLLTMVTAGGLADYVHAEAQRRDSELAAVARRRLAMVAAAEAREPFDPMVTCTPFTPEEDAEYDRLCTAYNERLATLAAGGIVAAPERAPLPADWTEWASPQGVSHAVPPAGPCATCGRGRHERRYILRQARGRLTAFDLMEKAPDGTERTILATLGDSIAVDVLEAVRAAYAHGCDDTNRRK